MSEWAGICSQIRRSLRGERLGHEHVARNFHADATKAFWKGWRAYLEFKKRRAAQIPRDMVFFAYMDEACFGATMSPLYLYATGDLPGCRTLLEIMENPGDDAKERILEQLVEGGGYDHHREPLLVSVVVAGVFVFDL
jgi:hypothetical protein